MIAQTLKNLPPFSPSQAGRHPIFIQNPLDSSTQRFHHYSRCSAFSMINRHDWVVIEFPRGRKPAPCSKKLRLLFALSGQDSTCTLREICVRHTFYACLTRARFAPLPFRDAETYQRIFGSGFSCYRVQRFAIGITWTCGLYTCIWPAPFETGHRYITKGKEGITECTP